MTNSTISTTSSTGSGSGSGPAHTPSTAPGSTHPRDQHGNPMTASSDVVALYDETLDRLLRFDVAVLDLAEQLAEHTATTPMAAALHAYLSLSSTDAADVASARECLDAMRATDTNPREAMHIDAIAAWSTGDWVGAARRLDHLLEQHPADLLALMFGHQLDFFLGDNLNLRDRPARSLPALDPQHPNHGTVMGMFAFGLEEAGSYAQAEEAGRQALATNADDVWALHAVAHVMEMQGRIDEGIGFMTERTADWGHGNLFTVHNWWHLGLYCLEAERHDLALEIYDREIHHEESGGVPIELLDASAMLWRFRLDEVDSGGRFDALADAWAAKLDDGSWYAFNDVHAAMALIGAGRLDETRTLISTLDRYLDDARGTNAAMTAEIGLPAIRAVLAHAEGRYADVIAELAPIRRHFQHFGGSHAQRDALQRTLLDAAIRAGDDARAQALLNERLTLRPSSVFGWTQQARLHAQRGATDAAAVAGATAREHRDRFATAVEAAS